MIKITDRAWHMMMLAARTAYGTKYLEVAGFAKARIDDAQGIITVEDVLIPPQEVGGAHADVDVEDLDWLMSTLLARGENPRDWFVWWHSHVSMSTSPSNTDHDTLFTLAQQSWAGFAVGLVVNVKHEHTGWVAYRSPILPNKWVEQNLPVEVEELADPVLAAQVADMMENVSEWIAPPVKVVQGAKFSGYGNPRQHAPSVSGKPWGQMTDEEILAELADEVDDADGVYFPGVFE
jgi:hypothetical protein